MRVEFSTVDWTNERLLIPAVTGFVLESTLRPPRPTQKYQKRFLTPFCLAPGLMLWNRYPVPRQQKNPDVIERIWQNLSGKSVAKMIS